MAPVLNITPDQKCLLCSVDADNNHVTKIFGNSSLHKLISKGINLPVNIFYTFSYQNYIAFKI